MSTPKIREARMSPNYPSFPGKVEYGCLHQSVRNGPLDRVYIEDLPQAAVDVLALREQGVKAVIVSREIPSWKTEELTAADLRAIVQEAREEEAREREAYVAQLAAGEEKRRQEDDGLGWKEL